MLTNVTSARSNLLKISKLTYHWISIYHFARPFQSSAIYRGLSALRFGVQETKNVMLILDSLDPKLKGDTDKVIFWTLLMLNPDFVIVLITNPSQVILRHLDSNSYCDKKNTKTSACARKPNTKTGTARDNQTLSINRNNREDPGFFLGGDAALRNGVTDWWG